MVPPTHDPDVEPAGPDWRDRLRLILQLTSTGLVILLKGAHDAAAKPLVELLQQPPVPDGDEPVVRVLLEASELLTAPRGSRVILLSPGQHARWLNLHRPVVQQRQLTLLLWCSAECMPRLQHEAPDFMDWVSHRVQIPTTQPSFLCEAMQECLKSSQMLALLNAPPPTSPWRVIPINTASYSELRAALRDGPVWVTGLHDALHWLTIKIAHLESGTAHGLLLANPKVIGEMDTLLDAAPLPWESATDALKQRGVLNPGITAALLDLESSALAMPRTGPVRIQSNPDWELLFQTAEGESGAEAVQAAYTTELIERLSTIRDKALSSGRVADIHTAQGDLDSALRIRTEEELPLFEMLGDVRERAVALGKIANLHFARGENEQALRIRVDEQIPAFKELGAERELAVTYGGVAAIHAIRGDLDAALTLQLTVELPIYEKLSAIGDLIRGQTNAATNLLKRNHQGDREHALQLLGQAYKSAVNHDYSESQQQIERLLPAFNLSLTELQDLKT